MNKLYAYILISLVFLLLLIGFFHQVTAFTQDLGRHLLLGKIILQSHTIPDTNLLSYTYPNFPFLNHHYLSEIIFYQVYLMSGTLGLLIMTTVIALFAFGLQFFYCLKKIHILPLCVTSFLLLQILFERTDIRPEVFSFLFVSLFTLILYRYRKRKTREVFLLPLFLLLWVNLHIYFFIGIILIGIFLLDAIITFRKNLKDSHVIHLLTILLLSLIASLGNPHFAQGALYPLHAFQNYGYTIEENQNIFFLLLLGFRKDSILYFQVTVIILFLSLLANFKKTKPVDWLLAISFSLAGALAVRNLPLFSFSIFIPLATQLNHLFSFFQKNLAPGFRKKTAFAHGTYLFFIAFFLWQSMLLSQKLSFGYSIDPGATAAADFFVKENIKGPLFNNFDIGSYIAYRLYPKEKVFIDGRPEAYPADFLQQTYIPMQQDPAIFAQIDKKYHFNVIFFSHTDQTPWGITFLQNIVKNPEWKIIYLDQSVIMLLKNRSENAPLLKKIGKNLDQIPLTNDVKQDKTSLLRLASFYSKIDQTNNEIVLYNRVLALDPKNCMALNNLNVIYTLQQNFLANVYATYFKRYCN